MPALESPPRRTPGCSLGDSLPPALEPELWGKKGPHLSLRSPWKEEGALGGGAGRGHLLPVLPVLSSWEPCPRPSPHSHLVPGARALGWSLQTLVQSRPRRPLCPLGASGQAAGGAGAGPGLSGWTFREWGPPEGGDRALQWLLWLSRLGAADAGSEALALGRGLCVSLLPEAKAGDPTGADGGWKGLSRADPSGNRARQGPGPWAGRGALCSSSWRSSLWRM